MEKGTTLNVSCDATGTPPPTVEWSKDGNALSTSQQVRCLTGKYEILIVVSFSCTKITVNIPSLSMHDNVSILPQNELEYNLSRMSKCCS